ncbi:MAG: hypothetical protein WDZ41_02070 [Candidatus Babeliales bacterium]
MLQHKGFVLRSYMPKKQKISILDESLGKIEATYFQFGKMSQLSAGVLMCYYPLYRNSWYELEQMVIYDMPFDIVRQDINFYHQVLELCYYFLPLNCAADDIFNLVQYLLGSAPIMQTNKQKKLFLVRFFCALGVYPEIDIPGYDSWDNLLSLPIDVMLKKTVKLSEEILEQWVLACLQTHPQNAHFKTMFRAYNA